MADVDLAILSNYSLDKIVDLYEDSFTVGAATGTPPLQVQTTATHTRSHSLSYTPFIVAMWSVDDINYRPIGVGIFDFSAADNESINVVAKATSTQVRVFAANLYVSTKTVYYRVYLLHPEAN